MRHRLVYAAFAVVVLALLAACQKSTTSQPETGAASPAPVPQDLVAEFSMPPVGTVWTYDQDGKDITWERLPDGTYDGKPVVRVDLGDGRIAYHDPATFSWIGFFDTEQQPIMTTNPHNGDYQWPLAVGSEWRTKRNWRDHKSGRSWQNVTTDWRVIAVEEVTTPAGTYRTLRMQSSPVHKDGSVQTRWYAPELGTFVKQEYRRNFSHARGGTNFERVLTSYTRPGTS